MPPTDFWTSAFNHSQQPFYIDLQCLGKCTQFEIKNTTLSILHLGDCNSVNENMPFSHAPAEFILSKIQREPRLAYSACDHVAWPNAT